MNHSASTASTPGGTGASLSSTSNSSQPAAAEIPLLVLYFCMEVVAAMDSLASIDRVLVQPITTDMQVRVYCLHHCCCVWFISVVELYYRIIYHLSLHSPIILK